MKTNLKMFASTCVYACIALMVSSCDKDTFFEPKDDGNKTVESEANDFDFSTTRAVDLIVDYSAFDTYGPVRFSIYDTNPVVNENTEDAYVSKNIKPILEVYTDERGKFDQTIDLPAYAKVLHIVTGNLAIGFDHSLVEVINNEAKLVVKNDGSTMLATKGILRAPGPGESTDVLGKLRSTAFEVNTSGEITGVQVYKEWGTPLGTWNTASGRPDYRMTEQQKASKGSLVLSDKEVEGMYNVACNILPNNSGQDNSQYRTAADVMLKDNSEITITALGSFTCWNTTLGYYYYNEETWPIDHMDLNPIMLFPNTQDGMRYGTAGDYQGNIGSVRGDVIQLVYYPHITDSDPNVKYSEPTTTFPKGTRIGFIIRTNGWGMMGKEYATKQKPTSSPYNKALNIWVSSTEGMSYANANLGSSFKYPNRTGEARTAMFSYTTDENMKYCILSFEDACDDTDYNDLIFALNPASVLLGLNDVEKDKTTKSGVYAFEDRWPSHSDYDMNDIMIDCKHEIFYNSKGKVIKEAYNLTTYQNEVADVSGLALRLNTKVTPSSIVMKKKAAGSNVEEIVTFAQDDQERNVYYLTDHITREINSTYILELSYSTPQAISKVAEIEPFIYGTRKNKDEEYTRWEVHLPGYGPTAKMDRSYFRTYDDFSVFHDGGWYKSNCEYPFGFYLDKATIEDFFDTILDPANESRPISEFYPGFIPWSNSKGATHADWYLNPNK